MLARSLELRLDPAAIMRRAGMPPDSWQVQLLRTRAERTLLLCSRQSGKSTVTAAMALHEVLFRPDSLVLLFASRRSCSGRSRTSGTARRADRDRRGVVPARRVQERLTNRGSPRYGR